MNIDVRIRSENLEGALKLYVVRRLQFSLARFATRIGRIGVQIKDVLRTERVVDKSCTIRVHVRGVDKIVRREVVDENLYVAIDLAADRIDQSVQRFFEDPQRDEPVSRKHGAFCGSSEGA